MPAVFKGSIACGVQRFNCLLRSKVQRVSGLASLSSLRLVEEFGIWCLEFGPWNLVFEALALSPLTKPSPC